MNRPRNTLNGPALRSSLGPIVALCVLVACVEGMAQLNVRDITLTNDVRTAGRSRGAIEWWQGESVRYTERALRDRASVDLTDATSVRWDVVDRAPATPASYIAVTGTVVSATNGIVRFTLTPAEANLPEGTYLGTVKAYQSTNYLGVLAEREIRVRYTPDSTNYAVVGPLTNLILHPDTTTIQAPTGFPFLIRAGDDGSNLTNLNVEAAVETFLDENPDTISDAVGGTTITWTSAPLTALHFTLESELVTTITNIGTEVATSLVGDVTWVEVATNPIRQVRRWVQVPYRGSLSGRTNTQSFAPASVATYDAATGLSTQQTAGAWGLTNIVTGGGETVTRWATYDWPANYAAGGDAYILALPGGTLASQALVDVDAAIAGAGSAIDLLSTWATASSATSGSHYVWATNLFFDAKRFAFQSVGDARSPGASGYNYGPLVLISSNAALTVLHSSSGGWVGDWVTFADTTGVSRLTYYQSLTDVGQDVGLVKLDPPLPPSVPVARLVDDADGDKLGSTTGTFGTPLLYYDGDLHLYLARLWRTYESSFYGFVVEPFDQAARAAKYAVLDHGGAFLVPTDDALILVGMHYTTTASRDWLPGMWASISNACVTAGAAVPTVYSLGAYNDR